MSYVTPVAGDLVLRQIEYEGETNNLLIAAPDRDGRVTLRVGARLRYAQTIDLTPEQQRGLIEWLTNRNAP